MGRPGELCGDGIGRSADSASGGMIFGFSGMLSRPSCFDFAARRNRNLVVVEIQHDADSLSVTDSTDLKNISSSFEASSLLVIKNTREGPLEDDTCA